jgi:hypothetical protein
MATETSTYVGLPIDFFFRDRGKPNAPLLDEGENASILLPVLGYWERESERMYKWTRRERNMEGGGKELKVQNGQISGKTA